MFCPQGTAYPQSTISKSQQKVQEAPNTSPGWVRCWQWQHKWTILIMQYTLIDPFESAESRPKRKKGTVKVLDRGNMDTLWSCWITLINPWWNRCSHGRCQGPWCMEWWKKRWAMWYCAHIASELMLVSLHLHHKLMSWGKSPMPQPQCTWKSRWPSSASSAPSFFTKAKLSMKQKWIWHPIEIGDPWHPPPTSK